MRFLGRALVIALLLAASLPGLVVAHAELVSSNPADGATIVGPFGGQYGEPIVLTFSEALAEGSKAELVGPNSASCACTATPDPQSPTEIPFVLEGALDLGSWEIRWTSVGADGDILRGIVHFTVVAATAAPPTPAAAPSATAAPASATATVAPSPTPAPSASGGSGTGSGADVLIPIVAMLVVIGAGLAWFLRRRGAA